MTRAMHITILAAASVVAFAAGRISHFMPEPFDAAAFSRSYRDCTDHIDAEYHAKVDEEFRKEQSAWAVAHPEMCAHGLLLQSTRLMLHERSDYGAFIQRRVDCAKQEK